MNALRDVRPTHLLALITLGCLSTTAAGDQVLFADDTTLEFSLTGPFKTIEKKRLDEERGYHEAVLGTAKADGTPADITVGLKARGNFRRKTCRQPPLRVRFTKGERAGTPFAKQRRLKLVQSCKRAVRYEQHVVEEYLLYRVYQVLSDYSFRVRPARVTFIDTERKSKAHVSYAFFIEDEDKLASRHGRKVSDWPSVEYAQLNARHAAIVEVFMFMIGAHDWSIRTGPPGANCCHNARLLVDGELTTNIIPVPYDFDFSGIINAPYASPPENLPIKKVTQRYFRGRCKAADLWAETFAHFRDRRDAIYAVYRDSAELSERNRKSALRYLDGFFDIISDDKRRERMILNRCHGD